jgi:hypothetical protein
MKLGLVREALRASAGTMEKFKAPILAPVEKLALIKAVRRLPRRPISGLNDRK